MADALVGHEDSAALPPKDWPDGRGFWRGRRVMVTGGNGFLGRFIVRKLHDRGAAVFVADIDRYDLRCLDDIRRALSDGQPQMVIHLAARVGGIPLRYATGRLRTWREP